MNGYDFYRVYQPLNLHFTTTYDIFKYSGKSKTISFDAFQGRKDRSIFDTWASRFGSRDKAGKYCLANFVYNHKTWLYEGKDDADAAALKWQRIRDAQSKYLNDDLTTLSKFVSSGQVKDWNSFFNPTSSGNLPPLLQLELHERITKDCCIAFDRLVPIFAGWASKLRHDPLAETEITLLTKYSAFVTIDLTMFRTNLLAKSNANS